MSVSVPSMGRMAGPGPMSSPLSGALSGLLGYEGSLMVGSVGAAAGSPRTSPAPSPHHSAAWSCPSIQVKQEPPMKHEQDHDSSGVSSMAHGSSFMSAMTNTSPSSSSSAGSPPGPAGHGHYGYHHHGHGHGHAAHPSLPAHQGGLSPRRASPASPPRPPSSGSGLAHSTPLTGGMGVHQGHGLGHGHGPASPHHDASAGPNPAAAKVPRTPGSVDDNSRSSTSSNSEDDADEQVRRLRATLEAANGSTAADSRERLSEHAAAHFKCTVCDLASGSADALRAHLRDVHDFQVPQSTPPSHPSPEAAPSDEGYMEQEHDEDLEGVATPRVNSQGKVKTFRCKQCEFVAVTKLDFWEHTKQHIKQEKMLCCPKCPFVTEYKHHLEYHLRNHFNSKPFKCDKCSYSCVNKSMLKSHEKSHSNVYQYRCADCTYATKYCHSLKLHLRKYGHQPSMVLNPDGTPNPLPIIDVYGTRRGPKTKNSKAAQQALQQQQQQQQQMQQKVPLPPQQFPHGMFPNPYGLPSIFPYAAAAPGPQDMPLPAGAAVPATAPVNLPQATSPSLHRCNYCDMTTTDPEVLAQHMFVHAEVMQNNLMQYFYANNNNYHQEDVKDFMGKAIVQPIRQASPPVGPVAPSPPQSPPRTPSSPRSAAAASPAAASPVTTAPGRPLDLSKPEHNGAGVEEIRETKNRRKGRAFKLERIAMRLQQQSSGDEAEAEHPVVKAPRLSADVPAPSATPTSGPAPGHAPTPGRGPASSPEYKPRSPPPSPPTSPAATAGKEEYNCSYCDIAFGDIVMYTMHMGYHGYQDPFKCNMCGQQTTDKVSFFLHIARSSHS